MVRLGILVCMLGSLTIVHTTDNHPIAPICQTPHYGLILRTKISIEGGGSLIWTTKGRWVVMTDITPTGCQYIFQKGDRRTTIRNFPDYCKSVVIHEQPVDTTANYTVYRTRLRVEELKKVSQNMSSNETLPVEEQQTAMTQYVIDHHEESETFHATVSKVCALSATHREEYLRKPVSVIHVSVSDTITIPWSMGWSLESSEQVYWRYTGAVSKPIAAMIRQPSDTPTMARQYRYYYDAEMSHRTQILSNLSLVISNVTTYDSGVYTLDIMNSGKTSFQRRVMVIVNTSDVDKSNNIQETDLDKLHRAIKNTGPVTDDVPSVPSDPKHCICVGCAIRMQLKTKDTLPPNTKIYWTKGDMYTLDMIASHIPDQHHVRNILSSGYFDRAQISTDGSQLTIKDTTIRDYGIYTGAAKTPNGSEYRTYFDVAVTDDCETYLTLKPQAIKYQNPNSYQQRGSQTKALDLEECVDRLNSLRYVLWTLEIMILVLIISILVHVCVRLVKIMSRRKLCCCNKPISEKEHQDHIQKLLGYSQVYKPTTTEKGEFV